MHLTGWNRSHIAFQFHPINNINQSIPNSKLMMASAISHNTVPVVFACQISIQKVNCCNKCYHLRIPSELFFLISLIFLKCTIQWKGMEKMRCNSNYHVWHSTTAVPSHKAGWKTYLKTRLKSLYMQIKKYYEGGSSLKVTKLYQWFRCYWRRLPHQGIHLYGLMEKNQTKWRTRVAYTGIWSKLSPSCLVMGHMICLTSNGEVQNPNLKIDCTP